MRCFLFFAFALLTLNTLKADSFPHKTSKNQILYCIKTGNINRGIELYTKLAKEENKHLFPILKEIGSELLQKKSKDQDEYALMLKMYAAMLAEFHNNLDLYEEGISTKNPSIQMMAIQCLGQIQDNRSEAILLKAFSSPFLQVRMEAAFVLALKKSKTAIGMIESLMDRLPPDFCVYFPELFAMIGTADAIGSLKKLVNDPHLNIRLFAILAAAKFGRDDFLTNIRASLTHPHQAEQETCSTALGYLQDSHSIPTLKQLAKSSDLNVKLAACRSLSLLGLTHFQEVIIETAKSKNLFAINLLSEIPDSDPLLISYLNDTHFYVRVNAALALLKKRNAACLPVLLEMLIKDEKDLGYQPIYSLGHTLSAWKVISSSSQYAKKMHVNIPALTLSLKEHILALSLELPEKDFLQIAEKVFDKNQNELIPHLTSLLENLRTQSSIALLQKESNRIGSPLIRTYSHLALYRMQIPGAHRENLYQWIENHYTHNLIEFRPTLSWTEREKNNSSFFITPEETSRLLIESFEALISYHDPKGIDLLLKAITKGNKQNLPVLAGLLLKSLI